MPYLVAAVIVLGGLLTCKLNTFTEGHTLISALEYGSAQAELGVVEVQCVVRWGCLMLVILAIFFVNPTCMVLVLKRTFCSCLRCFGCNEIMRAPVLGKGTGMSVHAPLGMFMHC